ncbi:MAG TPA: hypothetical protein VHM90_14515 [Phycisphaerae bacterium]|jgi:hypothetical protein|nr:hypothetical protein [Phycisphaerae bacterium]
MSRRLLSVVVVLGCMGAGMAVSTGFAADDQAVLPKADPREPSKTLVSWELNFKYGPVERVYVDIDGKSVPYWFIRYTVTNNSGKDVLFTPSFELVSENGEALQAFKERDQKTNIPAAVFNKIKGLYKNTLLMSPTEIYGKLLQGEDNARDGVIIFPAIDPNARNFKLFVMGLSGETTDKVINPLTGKPVLLQKTLELDLNIPGQAIGIEPTSKVSGSKWVMK